MMAAIKTVHLPTAAILIAMTVCGCDFLNPDRQLRAHDRPVRLISPSPAVDSLLSHRRIQDEEADRFWSDPPSKEHDINRVEERRTNPQRYYPRRSSFLLSMA